MAKQIVVLIILTHEWDPHSAAYFLYFFLNGHQTNIPFLLLKVKENITSGLRATNRQESKQGKNCTETELGNKS
jgi:hypothetical protein